MRSRWVTVRLVNVPKSAEQRRTTSGMLSPDAGGALVLTFALPVSRVARKAEVDPKIEECYRETARAFV